MDALGRNSALEVSFVIPSRNEPLELLTRTLARLHETASGIPYEVVVVDDASDVPIALVPHERVTLLRNAEPLGTMSTLRRGCAQASGRVLVILDAHMSFADDWLEHYLTAIGPRTLVCPHAWDYDLGTSYYFGADLFWRGGVRSVWWGYHWRLRRPRGRVADVPMVLGACYGLEREAYEHLGGFSPHYRVWGMVEQDLSYRAWMSGFRVRCATRARVGHFYRRNRPEGTRVSAFDARYNQALFGHCQHEESLFEALRPCIAPTPEQLSLLESPEVSAWRERVQSCRVRSDRELLRGPLRELGRTLPVSSGKTIRYRPDGVPSSLLTTWAREEERKLGRGLRALGEPYEAWNPAVPPRPGEATRVRAGAVTYGDRALLLVGGDEGSVPALQLELLRAGASLHSARGVLLDDAGRALGQATPLLLDGAEVLPESVGSSFSAGPRPIDLIAFVTYRPGTRWRLERITDGAAVLSLLARSDIVSGERSPALKRLRALASRARSVRVQRGSAPNAARRLLRLLREGEAGAPKDLSFVHYGTSVALELEDPRFRHRLRGVLPAGARVRTTEEPQARFRVERDRASGYRLRRDGKRIVARTSTLRALADGLESKLDFAVARRAEEVLFMHAGVVTVGDRAIVLPGRSHSGKSTLVRALVRAGARYLSDEYAVVDDRGWVWPYPKALQIRNGNGAVERVPIEELGGHQRYRPAPVGLILDTLFAPGSTWAPTEVSVGETYLTLMDNTVRARELPAATLRRATAMAASALRLQGPRPEAAAIARDLIARLEDATPDAPPR